MSATPFALTPPAPITADVRALRRQLRRQRLALTPRARLQASYQAVRQLRHVVQYVGHRGTRTAPIRVGVFVDAFGELPTQPLIDWAYRHGFWVYLPVVTSANKGLVFAKLAHTSLRQARLARHLLGMRQPASGARIRVDALDMVFMPLVGFDRQGHRIGMGGGFYDRTLAKAKAKPCKIGWAYDFQCVEQIDAAPWDISLDMAITPSRYWRFSRY